MIIVVKVSNGIVGTWIDNNPLTIGNVAKITTKSQNVFLGEIVGTWENHIQIKLEGYDRTIDVLYNQITDYESYPF